MGFRRSDLLDPNLTDSDRKDLEELLVRYLACDEWAKKMNYPMGILMTSHHGNRPFLLPGIRSHTKLGMWITLAYDNQMKPEYPQEFGSTLPSFETMILLDSFVLPYSQQKYGGASYPSYRLLRLGCDYMSNFEYLYCVNGDCILEKPENFYRLIDHMGDADLMSCTWDESGFNTKVFMGKTKVIKQILDHLGSTQEHIQQLQVYALENLFYDVIKEFGFSVATVENTNGYQLFPKGKGTWYDTVGLRSPHSELNCAYRYYHIPPEKEVLDMEFLSTGDKEGIAPYWETGDPRVLAKYWKDFETDVKDKEKFWKDFELEIEAEKKFKEGK